MAGHAARVGLEMCTGLCWETCERKRPLWSSKHALQDNIKTHLQEIIVAVFSWINLDHGREKWRCVVKEAVSLLVL